MGLLVPAVAQSAWVCLGSPPKVPPQLSRIGSNTLFIEPGSPWENSYCERFNGMLRDAPLNGEIFHSLKEAKIVI